MKWDTPPAVVEPVKEVTKDELVKQEKKSFRFGKGIRPALEIPEYKSSVMALYGMFHAGKTHFAATAPLPVVFIDTERRCDRIIKRMPAERQKEMFVFDVLEYAEVGSGDIDYVKMLDRFQLEIVSFANELKAQAADGVVGTIVVDSMSDIVRWYDQWLRQQPDVNMNKIQFEKGRSKTEIRHIVDIFKVTGWNIIMTFKSKQQWNEDGVPIDKYNPEWSNDLGYSSDFIVNIKKIGDRREYLLTKNAFGSTDLLIEDVDWDGFHKIIKENIVSIGV